MLPLLFVLWAGCETVPPESVRRLASGDPHDPGARPPARETLPVELLDAWFVLVDGERLARDEFLYRSRLAGRRWAEAQIAPPQVVLTWKEGVVVPPAVVKELMLQLRLAGFRNIDLGT